MPDVPLPRVAEQRPPGEAPEYVYALPDARPYVHAFRSWRVLDPASASEAGLQAALTSSAGVGLVLDPRGAPGECPAPPSATLDQAASARVSWWWRSTRRAPRWWSRRRSAMPRWRATVDGAPVAGVPAELAYLGAVGPAGRHTLRFTYAARAAAWAPLSALSLLVAAALLGVRRRASV